MGIMVNLGNLWKMIVEHKMVAIIIITLILAGAWYYLNAPQNASLSAEPIELYYLGLPPQHFVNDSSPYWYNLPQKYTISNLGISIDEPFNDTSAGYTLAYENDSFNADSYIQQDTPGLNSLSTSGNDPLLMNWSGQKSAFNSTFVKSEMSNPPDYILSFYNQNNVYSPGENYAPIWSNLTNEMSITTGEWAPAIATNNQSYGKINIKPFLKQTSYSTWEGQYYLDDAKKEANGQGFVYLTPSVVDNVTFTVAIPNGYTVDDISNKVVRGSPNGIIISETLHTGEVFDLKVTNARNDYIVKIGSDLLLLIIGVLAGVVVTDLVDGKTGEKKTEGIEGKNKNRRVRK